MPGLGGLEVAKILVVDDSMFQRHAVGKLLKEVGHCVLEAENGRVALQKAFAEGPDAMILDLIMPECNGFETLETLRKNGSQMPIFIFTADIQQTTRQKCLDLGATAFLNKPLNKDELKGILLHFLQ